MANPVGATTVVGTRSDVRDSQRCPGCLTPIRQARTGPRPVAECAPIYFHPPRGNYLRRMGWIMIAARSELRWVRGAGHGCRGPISLQNDQASSLPDRPEYDATSPHPFRGNWAHGSSGHPDVLRGRFME